MLEGRRFLTIALVSSVALPLAAKTPAKPKPAPSASASASAPPATPSTPEELEARRHFDVGLKLYKEKLYEAALVEFEQSYKVVPRPSALRNVAQCQRDLKRFADAYGAYERLLTVHATQMTPKELEAVKKAIKDLESVTGSIAFDVSESGASITVDGREVGPSPLTAPVRVDIGPHVVRVTKGGFEPFELNVKVLATQSLPVEAKLVKDVKTGRVTIKDKAGAKVNVWIDDVDRGPAPASVDLSPGGHIVELKGDGLASTRKTIEVVAKTETEHVLEATAQRGRLRVETLAKNGKIFLDGKEVGEGTWEDSVTPGVHRVKVVAKGFETHERLVAIEVGQTFVDAVTLVPVQTAPPAGPVAPAKNPFVGLYGRLSLLGGFSVTGAGEEVRPTCATYSCASTDASAPMGAGTVLQVGHSFGVFSAELVGAFLADFHQSKRTFTGTPGSAGFPANASAPAGTLNRAETYDYVGLAGFGGLGGRVTSTDDAVRFTFGASIGAAYRSVSLKRTTLDDEWKPGATGYFAPAVFVDAGLLLGSTPGLKLSIGVAAWMEFPGSPLTSDRGNPRPVTTSINGVPYGARLDSPEQQLRSGPQLYIGPTLGFQFGR